MEPVLNTSTSLVPGKAKIEERESKHAKIRLTHDFEHWKINTWIYDLRTSLAHNRPRNMSRSYSCLS